MGAMCITYIGRQLTNGILSMPVTEVFGVIVKCTKRRHRDCACSDSQVWGYKLEICMALRPTLPTGFIPHAAV